MEAKDEATHHPGTGTVEVLKKAEAMMGLLHPRLVCAEILTIVRLERIGRYLSHNFTELPSEAQRLCNCENGGEVFTKLDLMLRDHVLDQFLQKHPDCRKLLDKVFSSRYPYLKDQNLGTKERGDEEMTEEILLPGRQDGDEVWEPQIRPLSEAFRSRIQDREGNVQGNSWIVSYSAEPTPDTSMSLPAHLLYDCIDAFNTFKPLSWEEDLGNSGPDQMTLNELNLAERLYNTIKSTLQLPSVTEILKRAPNIAPHLITALEEAERKTCELLPHITKQVEEAILADTDLQSVIELQLEFATSQSDSSDEQDLQDDEQMEASLSVQEEMLRPPGKSTIFDTQLQPYKGWYIEAPKVQLTRAKNFLSDCDVDRTLDWQRKFAEITEYSAHLHAIFNGEDWGYDLKEVVDMLRIHWVFENYHYGERKLIVDFPTDHWPRESKRLPRLPGPDITLRRESGTRRDLTVPRQILHTPVTSAHDQQYELPPDVLRECYLQPFWEDSKRFWRNSPQREQSGTVGLVEHENKWYEDCMREGMVKTAKHLMTTRHFSNLEDIRISADGKKYAGKESLQAFARFRGSKRAALQNCLNTFDHWQNRHLCSPWSTLTLPEPRAEKKSDAGIIYSTVMMKDPPEKESRDPWAFTRAVQWFKQEELRWAQWTREHAIKDSYGHRRWLRSEEPVMELPKNWKGPVLNDLMDQDMRKSYEFLRRCQKIHQGLKRAARWTPRDFIHGLNKMVDAGLRGVIPSDANLSFAYYEFTTKDKTELAKIRPTEAAWLEYVCQPSLNRPVEPAESLEKGANTMLIRVSDLMKDISPTALFRNTMPRTMDEFLRELNLGCRGPVKRYRFTREDVLRLAPKLAALRVLEVYAAEDGELMYGRPSKDFHPEYLVKWPEPGPELEAQNDEDPESVFKQTQPKTYEDVPDDVSMASDATISTQVTVPPSIQDFHQYPKSMPRRRDVVSLREYLKQPEPREADTQRTTNFFYCLGYRLGITLNALQEQYEADKKRLNDPQKQEYNRDFLQTIISYWVDDTQKRPNNPSTNPAKKRLWRDTMIFPDVVKIADPDAYKANQEAWTETEWPPDHDARKLVNDSLIREVYENKTMLWPLPLPYNSYATEYKITDEVFRKRREFLNKCDLSDIRSHSMFAPFNEEKARLNSRFEEERLEAEKLQAERQTRAMRREPVWSFGHPSRKPVAHLFWDINNWPVHLQTKEKQEAIRSRGPKRRDPGSEIAVGEADVAGLGKQHEEYDVPFWKKAAERSKFIPGSDEFWMGDTPLQRKVFEARIRQRFESKPPSRPPPVKRFFSSFFGSSQKKPITDEDLILPEPHPSMIPKSRPYDGDAAGPALRSFMPTTIPDAEASDNAAGLTPTIPIIVVSPIEDEDEEGCGEARDAEINYHLPDETAFTGDGRNPEDMEIDVRRPYIELRPGVSRMPPDSLVAERQQKEVTRG